MRFRKTGETLCDRVARQKIKIHKNWRTEKETNKMGKIILLLSTFQVSYLLW